MPEIVFWDTAAFVALGNADDNLHGQAVLVSQSLARQRARILTTSAVLVEVANAFSRPGWRSIAEHAVHGVLRSVAMGAATLAHMDAALWQQGWQLFLSRPDKEWSLTDCVSFVVMQAAGVDKAFTSDRHFEQAGFARLLHT